MRPKLSDTIITYIYNWRKSREIFMLLFLAKVVGSSQDPFGSREAIKSSLQDDPLLVRDIIN